MSDDLDLQFQMMTLLADHSDLTYPTNFMASSPSEKCP